jgi:hypothetical protein
MLVLDPLEMQLTVVNLQFLGPWLWPAIVDAGEDKLGIVSVGECKGTLDLFCKTWWNSDDGTEDWEHKIIPLPELGFVWHVVGAIDGYLLLESIQLGLRVYYILELKTLLFERLRASNMGYHSPSFFASFPPPLSLPTI